MDGIVMGCKPSSHCSQFSMWPWCAVSTMGNDVSRIGNSCWSYVKGINQAPRKRICVEGRMVDEPDRKQENH